MAATALSKALMVLEEFRKLHAEMPMQIAVVLLQIAKKPDISLRELTTLTGLGKSSVSRHVSALSIEFNKDGPTGGLVTYREDPADRRNKIVKLTPKGERFIRTLTHYIDPNEEA